MAEVTEVDLVRTLYGHSSDVTSVDFKDNMLATCSSDKSVRLWSFDAEPETMWELPYSPLLAHKYTTGELDYTLKHPSGLGVRVCTISSNGSRLATAGEDDCIIVWDLNTRSLLKSLEGHEATVTAVSFTPDGSYLISGSNNCDLALWPVSYGGDQWLYRTLEAHDLGVLCASFSPTFILSDEEGCKEPGNNTFLLASGGNDCLVRLWHVKTGELNSVEQQLQLEGHSANVFSCKFSADGSILATTAGDKTVIIWDPLQGAILQKLERHTRYVTCCAFTSDGRHLATGSNDKTVIIWKLHRGSNTISVPVERQRPSQAVTVDFQTAQSAFKLSSLPDEYHCPITHELMRDPVIAADGFTYEQTAIMEWFESGKDSSPMTNDRLPHMQLTPNLVLKMLIQRNKESK
uniref:U-box domain-containing protein n=1 Tax=Strigamia maritima TaxID=126957 RepID=T1IUY7_STRMM